MALSTVPAGVAAEALGYLREGGPANLRELAAFLSDTVLLTGEGFAPPETAPAYGLHHLPAPLDAPQRAPAPQDAPAPAPQDAQPRRTPQPQPRRTSRAPQDAPAPRRTPQPRRTVRPRRASLAPQDSSGHAALSPT